MNERQREHLTKQLEHEAELAKREISRAVQEANRAIARRGITASSIHTKAIAEVVRDHLIRFAKTCFECAFSIASGSEAHAIAQKFANAFADSWTPKSDAVTWPGVSSLRGQGSMGLSIMHQSADSMGKELSRIYELEAFRFNDAGREANLPENASPVMKPSKVGRPPAEWWDDMWVAIMKQIYEGALQPKRQVDIENAMQEWIVASGRSAATSTVRKRARKLWDALSLEDEN